jgi:hypothetical protein
VPPKYDRRVGATVERLAAERQAELRLHTLAELLEADADGSREPDRSVTSSR